MQLKSVGIRKFEFVYAKRPRGKFNITNMRRAPLAEFAVNLSHIKAIVHAIADGAQRPLFIEDDIVFSGFERLKSAFGSIPDGWDVLYLGGHPCGTVEPVGEHLVSVQRFSFAEAYSINGASLQKFHDYWLDRIGQTDAMFDRILGEFAEKNESFCVYPIVTRQLAGFSHVANRIDDKSDLVDRGWQNNI